MQRLSNADCPLSARPVTAVFKMTVEPVFVTSILMLIVMLLFSLVFSLFATLTTLTTWATGAGLVSTAARPARAAGTVATSIVISFSTIAGLSDAET
jgi:hypothetical protein